MRWSVLIASAFLTGCAATATSDAPREVIRTVAPDLETYGAAFKGRMADELEALPAAECPRTGAMPADCSALLTYTLDQQRLRDQVRRLRE